MPAAPIRLRCEYRVDPIGIDETDPRLSWEVVDPQRGAVQSRWQVQAAASDGDLAAGRLLWDSGEVASARSYGNTWGGPALTSRQRILWRVRTWDGQGKISPWSQVACLEMGLLSPTEWSATWIAGTRVGGPTVGAPAPYLRRAFPVAKEIASARLYITAGGLYHASINGQRVGDLELVPGWSDFAKRIYYQTYEVTSLLRRGDNVLGAVLGDGWYCGHIAAWGRSRYGDRPCLLARLEITHGDGTRSTVVTDDGWRWQEGSTLTNDLLMGEACDARRSVDGWDQPGFDDASWQRVVAVPGPAGRLQAQRGHHTVRREELKPKDAPAKGSGWGTKHAIFDFGQNLVGRLRITVAAPAGTTLTLRFAEVLDAKGGLYTTNLRSARCIDEYICRGGGPETWEPSFTFHGFRYAQIAFLGAVELTDVTAVVLHADMAESGGFTCSDGLVNQLQSNIRWGQKGNFLEVPTDCPQRDERLGWTGDAQVFARTACFNHDVAQFLGKWCEDVADAQASDGSIPPFIPQADPNAANDGGPAWSDAAVIVPWTLWRVYGDDRVLRRMWPVLTAYVDQLAAKSLDLIRSHPAKGWGGFGDWLALDGSGKTDGGTPKDLIGTAFLAEDAKLMGRIARIIGEDPAKWDDLHRRVREAFIRRYVTPAGLVAAQTQTAYALGLAFDLIPAEGRTEAAAALVRDVESRGDHLSTGFVGTPHLPHVLTAVGRSDVAWRLLFQRTCPSWLFPVLNGATTIWERWDGWTPDKGFQDPGMNSFNHYAYGAIGSWCYQSVAGLDLDSEKPAYDRVMIRPQPGSQVTEASARHRSMHGEILSGWKRDAGTLTLEVLLPPNTTAAIHLPTADAKNVREGGKPLDQAEGLRVTGTVDGSLVLEAGAGRYAFTMPDPLAR